MKNKKGMNRRQFIKNSAVGMVGAGGIGVILWENIRGFYFAQTCAVMIIIVVTVSLLDILSQPYQDPPEQAGYHLPPPPSAKSYRTFCGT